MKLPCQPSRDYPLWKRENSATAAYLVCDMFEKELNMEYTLGVALRIRLM
jgi:hypothetical protein